MLYTYEPVPKGAPSDTSSSCGLALILMVNYLLHCSPYLTLVTEKTLKRNKSSYELDESGLDIISYLAGRASRGKIFHLALFFGCPTFHYTH